MRELLGVLLIGAGLVAVLFIALRGFRPRSSRGGRAKARSRGFLKRYRPRTNLAFALAGVPTGWAVGKIAAEGIAQLGTAILIGVVFGLASLPPTARGLISAMVGAVGLGVAIVELTRVDVTGDIDPFFVVGAVLVACAIGAVAGLFGDRRTYLPLTLMAAVELVIFGIELQQIGAVGVSVLQVVGVAVVAIPITTFLVGVGPELVLPLLGIGLVTAELLVAGGALGQRPADGAVVVLAATAGFVAVMSIGGRWSNATA